ncbi:hypothetical protein [Streptomyces sp. NPDC048411]|uniref:hypothetical protein n=1 Tax=Streptomyces sp. NPDC048411 TaxID=3157206 RepID=UPI0034526166
MTAPRTARERARTEPAREIVEAARCRLALFGWIGFELPGQFEGTLLERRAAFDHHLHCQAKPTASPPKRPDPNRLRVRPVPPTRTGRLGAHARTGTPNETKILSSAPDHCPPVG